MIRRPFMRLRSLLCLLLTLTLGLAARTAFAGGAITSGSTVTGAIAGPSFLEQWTFSGTAGQRVIITAVTTSGAIDTNILLKAPGGGTETSTQFDRIDQPLAATGTYTIEVQDVGLNDAGGYKITFVNLTAGPYTSVGDTDGGAIVSSDAMTGSMSGASDIDVFTFTGTIGNRVVIDAVATGGVAYNTNISLYPVSGGAAVFSTPSDRAEYQLASTGTWAIVVEDYGDDTTGNYALSLLNVTAGPFTNGGDADGGAIASSEVKTGQFQQGVDLDAYTFFAFAGSRVILTGVGTGGTANTNLVLYPPGGTAQVAQTFGGDRLDFQVAGSGTYTVVLEDYGNVNTGNYTVSLMNVTAGPFSGGGDVDGGLMGSAEVKTGSMSGVCDMDAFTFTGAFGDRVLIDAVATGGALNTNISLYPPGGGVAVVASASDRAEFQLTAAGVWTIVIEDYGDDAAGNYSLSLLNVTTGPLTIASDPNGGAIASNEIKTGQFQQGVDFDAFTFSGAAGNRVIMVGVATGAGTHNTNLLLYPPGGGAALGQSYGADRIEIQLPAGGSYTLVVEDYGNANTGNYTVSLANVTAGPYTNGGDTNGGAIVSADVKTGSMSGVGDMDVFTFTGTMGDRVLIDAVATGGALNTNISLYLPAGGAAPVSTASDRAEYQLTATGTWVIVVEDYGDDTAGNYALSLLNVTAGPLTNGGDTDGGAIASSEMKTGQFQQGVDFDAFTLTGAAGDRVVMVAVAGAGLQNTNLILYPPAGGALVAQSYGGDRLEAQLPSAGNYTILVEDYGNVTAGNYTLSMVNLTAGPYTDGGDTDGGAIASADVKNGTMSGVTDVDVFTFSGNVGARVLIDAVATGGGVFNTNISLYPPAGAAAPISTASDRTEYQLTATGTWAIVIEDYGDDAAGNYALSLLNVTAGPLSNGGDTDGGAIASNEIKTGQFQQGVDFDAFTFTGAAGDRVVLVGLQTGGAANPNLLVYPPGGGPFIGQGYGGDRMEVLLPVGGTYTVTLEDYGNVNTGNYALSLMNVTAGPYTNGGDANGGAIASADVKTGSMSGVADVDVFTFTGTIGHRILIDAVATGGVGFNTNISLYPPAGGSAVVSTANDRAEFQLTATGTWAVVIEDYGDDAAGNYALSLLNVTAGPLSNGSDADGGAILSNEIKTGQFQQGVDFDAFSFTGTAGDRVVLIGVTTGGTANTTLALYPPNGGVAIAQSYSGDRMEAQLASTGTYKVVVEDYGNINTGNYSVSLLNVTAGPLTNVGDTNGGPIVSNTIVTGSMSGVADADGYSLSGTFGKRIAISAVATGGAGYNTAIYLFPPGGGAAIASTTADRLEYQLWATGTWIIVIEDNGNDTAGNYALSFLNINDGPYSGGGETDGGALNTHGTPAAGSAISAADFDGYTFYGLNGQTANITATTTLGAMDTQITLYPPGGGAAVTSTTSDNVVPVLTLNGYYTIVIEDYGQDQTGNYSLTLNLSAGPTGVGDRPMPIDVALQPGVPSPFAQSTRLDFDLPHSDRVLLRVFDVTGARVRTLVDEDRGPGHHAATWDGRDDHGARVASGVYYVQLETRGEMKRQKLVLVR